MAAINRPVMNAEKARRAALANTGKNRAKGDGHPTTGAIDYSERELEFMRAIERFKLETGRKFPTWREVLGVIDRLGYERVQVLVCRVAA